MTKVSATGKELTGHSVDVTDLWNECADPENRYGDQCRAYFEAFDESGTVLCTGFSLENLDGIEWGDRESALLLLGAKNIAKIEHDIESNPELVDEIIKSQRLYIKEGE